MIRHLPSVRVLTLLERYPGPRRRAGSACATSPTAAYVASHAADVPHLLHVEDLARLEYA
jgi:hypothetical protein